MSSVLVSGTSLVLQQILAGRALSSVLALSVRETLRPSAQGTNELLPPSLTYLLPRTCQLVLHFPI